MVEVKVACFNTNQLALNVLHYKVITITGAAIADDEMAITVDNKMEAIYKSLLGNTSSYYGIRLQIIGYSPKPVAVVAAENTGAGTAGTGVLPGQVCAVITKQTNIAGRSGRGRYYIPFPPTAADDATLNKPTDAYFLLLQAAATELDDPISCVVGGAEAIMALCVKESTTSATRFVNRLIARQAWGTQRRRGNYGQPNVYPPF